LGTVAGFIAAGSGLSEKLGRKLLLIGTATMMAGTAGVAITVRSAGPGISPYELIPALVFLGAGMGLAMAPFFDIVLAGVDDEETGSASGALTSVQQLGGAFGIAVLGTIFVGLLPGAVVHAGSAQVDTAIGEYARTAVRAGFIDTTVRTLGVAFLLLLLAFATAFLLPRKARPEAVGH
jgi:MFS family permease